MTGVPYRCALVIFLLRGLSVPCTQWQGHTWSGYISSDILAGQGEWNLDEFYKQYDVHR